MRLYAITAVIIMSLVACAKPAIVNPASIQEKFSDKNIIVPKDAHKVYCGPTPENCFDVSRAFCSNNSQENNTFSSIDFDNQTLMDWIQDPKVDFSLSNLVEEEPNIYRVYVVCKP